MSATLWVERVGKLQSAAEVAPSSTADQLSKGHKFRLFVIDKNKVLQFFVDSGAEVSIIPVSKMNK